MSTSLPGSNPENLRAVTPTIVNACPLQFDCLPDHTGIRAKRTLPISIAHDGHGSGVLRRQDASNKGAHTEHRKVVVRDKLTVRELRFAVDHRPNTPRPKRG